MEPLILSKREAVKELKKNHGKKILGEANIANLIAGGHNIPSIFSQFSPHDHHVKDIKHQLFDKHHKHRFEAFLWYLLTTKVPSVPQVEAFAQDLQSRATIPQELEQFVYSLSPKISAKVKVSMAWMFLQPHSKFLAQRKTILKTFHWKYVIEDVLDIIAKAPLVLNLAYHEPTKQHLQAPKADCYASTSSQLLNIHFRELDELLVRLAGSDGSSPFVHVPRLVNCSLTDPYLATTALVNTFSTYSFNQEIKDLDLQEAHVQTKIAKLDPVSLTNLMILAKIGGSLCELFWDRALMFPLENPKSLDLVSLQQIVKE